MHYEILDCTTAPVRSACPAREWMDGFLRADARHQALGHRRGPPRPDRRARLPLQCRLCRRRPSQHVRCDRRCPPPPSSLKREPQTGACLRGSSTPRRHRLPSRCDYNAAVHHNSQTPAWAITVKAPRKRLQHAHCRHSFAEDGHARHGARRSNATAAGFRGASRGRARSRRRCLLASPSRSPLPHAPAGDHRRRRREAPRWDL